jgi:hypothetical protein
MAEIFMPDVELPHTGGERLEHTYNDRLNGTRQEAIRFAKTFGISAMIEKYLPGADYVRVCEWLERETGIKNYAVNPVVNAANPDSVYEAIVSRILQRIETLTKQNNTLFQENIVLKEQLRRRHLDNMGKVAEMIDTLDIKSR